MGSIWDSPYSLFRSGGRKGKTKKEIEERIRKEKENYQKHLEKEQAYMKRLRDSGKHPDDRKTKRNR
jgi:hypothetical protein